MPWMSKTLTKKKNNKKTTISWAGGTRERSLEQPEWLENGGKSQGGGGQKERHLILSINAAQG